MNCGFAEAAGLAVVDLLKLHGARTLPGDPRDIASREQAADRLFMARDRADGRQAVSNRPIADSRITELTVRGVPIADMSLTFPDYRGRTPRNR